MSGIAGIMHLDGKPVDENHILKMSYSMQRRGPDYQQVKVLGHVGLAFAALNTTPESLNERQPFTINGNFWIVADARIDNRDELRRYFNSKGIDIGTKNGNAEYILRAYEVWGDDCPKHLLGDFAFAIWDDREQKLFCARDHFGVKPFVYYLSEKVFVCATEIRALLAHPYVPEIVNEARIADYLILQLEGRNKITSLYKNIFRLPAGHILTFHNKRLETKEYWKLETPQELRLKSDGAYQEAFLEQFTQAVVCRLRAPSTEQVGSMLSGGLDSSSIVGVARHLMNEQVGVPFRTFSAISREGKEDEETRHSLAVIEQGGLDARTVSSDEMSDYLEDLQYTMLHNTNLNTNIMEIPQLMYAAAHRKGVRILFDGVGADDIVALGQWYIGLLMRTGHWLRALIEAKKYGEFWGHNFYPFHRVLLQELKSIFVPQFVRRIRQKNAGDKHLQAMLSEHIIKQQFAQEQSIVSRLSQRAKALDRSRLRKASERQAHFLNLPFVTVAMERYDAVASVHTIEPRRPYMDKRLVEFCLSLPLNQKMRDGWTKTIVRKSMEGLLPHDVLWRKGKSHLGGEFMNMRHQLELAEIESAIRNDWDLVSPYVDYAKFSIILQKYRDCSILSDISIWQVVTLIKWLKEHQ